MVVLTLLTRALIFIFSGMTFTRSLLAKRNDNSVRDTWYDTRSKLGALSFKYDKAIVRLAALELPQMSVAPPGNITIEIGCGRLGQPLAPNRPSASNVNVSLA